MKNLQESIQRLCAPTPEQVDGLLNKLQFRTLQRGEFLLKLDEICHHYYFLESGALRLYHLKGKKDYTAWIATDGEIFTNLESYNRQTPSTIFIEAIEPTQVGFISREDSEALILEFPFYNTLLRRALEDSFITICKNALSFQSDQAIERYERMESESNWLLRFPQKYLSSFMGITKSSLSRLRRNRK